MTVARSREGRFIDNSVYWSLCLVTAGAVEVGGKEWLLEQDRHQDYVSGEGLLHHCGNFEAGSIDEQRLQNNVTKHMKIQRGKELHLRMD